MPPTESPDARDDQDRGAQSGEDSQRDDEAGEDFQRDDEAGEDFQRDDEAGEDSGREEPSQADSRPGTQPQGDGATGDQCRVDLDVPDMDCASCANKVESGVSRIEGVDDIEPKPTTGTLTVRYDAGASSPDDVEAAVTRTGYDVAAVDASESPGAGGTGAIDVRLSVPDMDCSSCASTVQAALEDCVGVQAVETRPTTGSARVTYDADATTTNAVVDAVESAGYEVTATDELGAGSTANGQRDDPASQPSTWRSPRALKTALGGVFLAFAILTGPVMGGLATVATIGATTVSVADVAFLAATAVAGQEILRGGYYSARNRQLDIDFLMSAAIVAAITASVAFGEHLYFEAATLAVLFSVSELLESYAMDRTRNSLQELVELSPDEATVQRDDGTTETVTVDELAVGDVVVVKPGEKVPADGVVVDGESAIDEAPVTGESVPVDKTRGDEVYAGTINEEGYVEVEVRTPAGEDTLSRIVELVEDAQTNQTEREQFVERFASYYTPVMVAVAIGVAVVPPLALGAPWTPWFVNGITMLVLACPCAFVISTPVSVVSGVTSAARNGVLVKGGNYLEAMGSVDAIALDKTGTLTKGELTVTDVVPIGDRTREDVLRCASALESRSEHPIADAIVAHADDTVGPGVRVHVDGEAAGDAGGEATAVADAAGRGGGVEDVAVDDFESVTGKGVQADLHGHAHYAGKPAWFDDLGFDLEHAHVVGDSLDGERADATDIASEVRDRCEREGCLNLADDTIPRLQSEGKTVVLVGTEDKLEGVVAVADEIRPGARATVESLQAHGLDVVMLTGDNHGTARAVAEHVGISDYRAGLLPEDKVDAVQELTAEYDGVAMVGDGVNDAPALATATVGVAMGAAGTDTAIETADIALLSDDVTKLPYLYDLSHEANDVIRQSIYASLGVKALLAVGVPLGYVSVALAVLAGDAGMTLGVTGNALRLGRITPDVLSDE